MILSVGLGAIDSGFDKFGEECDRRIRAELMDECLDIVTGLWDGQPFAYDGKHYTVEPTDFPTIGHVVQEPRVPIWCVGAHRPTRSRWRGRCAGTVCSRRSAATSHPSLDQVRGDPRAGRRP